MGMAALPARRRVARSKMTGHAAWRRLGRLTALTLAYVLLLTLLRMAVPTFSDWWIEYNLFALCYPYLLAAVWLGDVWEAASALTISAVAAPWFAAASLHVLPFGTPFWAREVPDGGGWLLYVASGAAIVALVHRRRGTVATMETAVPLVSTDMESPVLVIKGQVQVLRGGGVIFDSKAEQGTTAPLTPVKGRPTRD